MSSYRRLYRAERLMNLLKANRGMTSTGRQPIFDVETRKDFEQRVINSDRPVVVDFHARWAQHFLPSEILVLDPNYLFEQLVLSLQGSGPSTGEHRIWAGRSSEVSPRGYRWARWTGHGLQRRIRSISGGHQQGQGGKSKAQRNSLQAAKLS